MSKDKEKENRWARVLADAGLLDDVDDAWTLPQGAVRSGTSITVIGAGEKGDEERRDDDVTAKIVTMAGASTPPEDPQGEEGGDSQRLSWSMPPSPGEESLRPSIPFSRVTPTADMSWPSSAPPPPRRTDTEPSPMARHARWSEAPPKMPEEPPVDIASQRAPRDDTPVVISPSNDTFDAPGGASEDEAAAGPVVTVGAQRISVVDSAGPVEPMGTIVDEPVSIAPEPIELPEPEPTRSQMVARYDMGDFSGALAVAEKILANDPDNMDALQFKANCQEKLLQMYESRIGDMSRVPRLAVEQHELMWRNLDATAGFVLSRVDGLTSFEDIIDISGMPRFEVCRILDFLLQEGIIS